MADIEQEHVLPDVVAEEPKDVAESLELMTKEEEARLPKMQLWERKLLDFSLRNNFLNLRIRGKVIPLVCDDIAALEDLLQDGGSLTIKAKTDETGQAKPNVLMTGLDERELELALKNLHRAARVAMEENGANTLFVVLGMLHWYESPKTETPRLAPLLLMPVDIVRKIGGKYEVRMRDEDVVPNTTLIEMMRQQFDVDFSALKHLPLDEHGVDVPAVLNIAREAVKEKSRWTVEEEAVLGLFSFNKFVMWNDLHNGADKMKQNPIIQTLVEGKLADALIQNNEQPGKEIDAKKVDVNDEPRTYAVPLDVDSSQLEAVIESGEGRSFILYGPPGTGKSQTITNMIANALYHGRRVLFVAEKMAALSVVQKRLEKIGIGAFCLEMHSNKATKTHFLNQMEQALEVAHKQSPSEYAALSQRLFEQRKQLIAYMDALHTPATDGLSLYDCITGGLAIALEPMNIGSFDTSLTKEQLLQKADQLRQLDALLDLTGPTSKHPLKELYFTDTSVGASRTLSAQITNAQARLANIGSLTQTYQQLKEVSTRATALKNATSAVTTAYGNQSLALDPVLTRTQWQQTELKWFLPKIFAKRSMRKMLKTQGCNIDWDGIPQLCDRLDAFKAAQQRLQEMSVTNVDDVCAFVAATEPLKPSIDTLSVPEIAETMNRWAHHTDLAHDWALWSVKRQELEQNGLQCAVNYIMQRGATGSEAADAFLRAIYERKAESMIDADQQLQMFNGLLFEQMIQRYRDMARQFQELTKQELYAKLASRIPNLTLEAAASSEVGILKRNIKSKGRGTTIRQLVDQIPTLLPRLCPCMLMSPISVAQYIDLERAPFDIVMFDEASQMPTSEAVGAIARGRALVCVGDPKQMPPTSFFTTQVSDEEMAAYDDMESILDDCITLSLPARYLTWHYRSKHESLIAFSNKQYYEGKLFTFPSVDDRQSKVNLVHVDGVYDMGKTRQNRSEAEAIVKETLRRLSDDELSKRSIGIVSFSKVQQDLIEDILEEELAKNPKLEEKAYGGEEPIFVKNLENVQGDERDVILFSVGYGPDKDGKVSMNFGPLNNAGGERRLNVAVSRARYEMMVFSTLRPEQIDLNRTQAEGVVGLKRFLEFAGGSTLHTSGTQQTGEQATTSYMVEAIAHEIETLGYKVDRKVGRSNFKVDLAVVDPKDEGTYCLGIMIDGRTYYQTKTQRDREICQPSVLNMLGWRIMKVWSVDWFLHRDAVLERIRQVLEGGAPADTQAATASVEAAPVAVVADTDEEAVPQDWQPVSVDNYALPYTRASVAVQQGEWFIEEIERKKKTLDTQVAKIIETEQPITFSLLCRRMADVWQQPRVTPRFQKLIESHLGNAYLDPEDRQDAPYYWASFEQSLGYEKFRTGSGRDIADIPLVEVKNCLRCAVEQMVACPVEDLKRQASRILGYSRITPKLIAVFDRALSQLQKTGVVVITDNMVKMRS
ncbi:MAG: DUF3320 domain-containing protein [Bacteroidaceae bacterium]|nr:DUF3320 domain-containing protein [Bacteroidaceae bacterium]